MQREALEHKPTTRPCVVLPPATLSEAAPYSEPGTRYVLVLAAENAEATFSLAQARAWLDAGASYVCTSGPGASAMEESFDYASFLPEVGAPLPFTLMTTSHEKQTFEEALWFAFWCSAPHDDLPEDLTLVVVQPSSERLAKRARSWVQSNLE